MSVRTARVISCDGCGTEHILERHEKVADWRRHAQYNGWWFSFKDEEKTHDYCTYCATASLEGRKWLKQEREAEDKLLHALWDGVDKERWPNDVRLRIDPGGKL